MTGPVGAFYMAVDAGGSHTAIRIEHGAGAVVFQTDSGPSIRTNAGTPDMRRLVRLLGDSLVTAGVSSRDVESCAVGAASLPPESRDYGPLVEWAATGGVRHFILGCDAVTSYLGALGDGAGGVLSCGTGVIGVSRSLTNSWRRVDGWGYLLGDAGGGDWIGTQGLRAALRAHDGRPHGSVHLLRAVRAQFGSPRDAIATLNRSPNPAQVAATFVPAVLDAASADDEIAGAILTGAVAHLADAAVALMPADSRDFSYLGGLFRSREIASPFETAVHERRPDIVLRQPKGDALDGAMMLARVVGSSAGPIAFPGLTVFRQQQRYVAARADCDWQFAQEESAR